MNINNLFRFFTDENIRFGYLKRLGAYKSLSDERFLKLAYKINLKKQTKPSFYAVAFRLPRLTRFYAVRQLSIIKG